VWTPPAAAPPPASPPPSTPAACPGPSVCVTCWSQFPPVLLLADGIPQVYKSDVHQRCSKPSRCRVKPCAWRLPSERDLLSGSATCPAVYVLSCCRYDVGSLTMAVDTNRATLPCTLRSTFDREASRAANSGSFCMVRHFPGPYLLAMCMVECERMSKEECRRCTCVTAPQQPCRRRAADRSDAIPLLNMCWPRQVFTDRRRPAEPSPRPASISASRPSTAACSNACTPASQ
jgi:hypothetical protein